LQRKKERKLKQHIVKQLGNKKKQEKLKRPNNSE
jgi:hypothetical protein